ncbi:MAG: fatty acid--CoA ligase family protein [Polyangiales bacterium]
MTLQEMARAAFERDPALEVVEFEHRWYTWGELRQVADRLRTLIDESGAGASVAFAPRNCPSALAALLGLIAEGRTIKMVYVWQSGAGIARDLERLKPSVFVAAPQELSSEVRETARSLGIALIALTDMDAAFVPGFAHTQREVDPDAPASPQLQILTSGTTGLPKQFPIPYELLTNVLRAGATMFATHGANLATMPPVLLFFPIGNITGIYSTVPTLIQGMRIVLLERFTLDGWRDHVRRFKPPQAGLPAAGVQMVLDADVPREELASIRTIGTGAAPVDPAVQRAFEERYGIPILLAYGATEFGGRVCSMTAADYAQYGQAKLGSVGRAVGGAKIRVVDPETGAELGANEEGLFEVVSPHMGPHWIRTTDLGVIDQDGFVFHRARADGAIMRGGFKVLPETIERALALHASVVGSAVVGVTDRRLGQVPAAAVQLRAPVSFDELASHLRQHVPATHIPTQWRVIEELPRNASMKVDRAGVRRLFEG